MLLNDRYIGLMSGTSVDGVDAVLADFAEGKVGTLGHVHLPFAPALREALQGLMHSGADEIERAGDASVALARCYADAVAALLAKTGMKAAQIAAIGAHGQTIRHRPERGFTTQINQPALIAELTGISVVADFRSRDVAAGGQGAPLVPAFHAAVFSGSAPRAVVNIGGIANVTLLPAKGSFEPVRGFDTGPGNTLLDAWCERHTGHPFDDSGSWGAQGTVNNRILSLALCEPYLTKPPPKSTGRELFNLQWLDDLLAKSGERVAPVDVQATLVRLTAETIAEAIVNHLPDVEHFYACGGGVCNIALMNELEIRLKQVLNEATGRSEAVVDVSSTALLGVDPMHVEALAFAWLARQCFASAPGNVPAVTGAKGPRILGAVYPA